MGQGAQRLDNRAVEWNLLTDESKFEIFASNKVYM